MKQIQLIGNLGQNARLVKHAENKFVSFTLGVNTKSHNENEQNLTTWFNITASNSGVLEFLKKGTKVFLQGEFTFKDNKYLNVSANKLILLDSKKQD